MPPPRVVTGPLGALEPALAAHVAALQRDDPLRPVVIVTGETLLRAYLRRRLAELNGPHLSVHILTPGELGLRLGELHRLLEAKERPLPMLADRLLAAQAALDEDSYFDAVRETPGFGDALHRTLVELRRAGVSPAALKQAAPTSLEPEKTASLAALAARHHDLRRGYYDADLALASADPERLGADELLVYGLWEAPTLMRDAIAAVAATRPVHVFLPTAHDLADQAHLRLRSWLHSELGATLERLEPQADTATALAHVQRHLGAQPSQPEDPADGSIRLVSTPDPAREVRAALRACLRWARDHQVPFHEMAIAYRQADPYRSLLDAALREAGLPAYVHEGTPLSELPLGRRALALLDLMEGDLDRAAVIAFAADSRFPQATRERFPGSGASWDRISRKAGVVRGHQQWIDRLTAHRAAEASRTEENGGQPHWLPQRLAEIDGLRGFISDLSTRISRRPREAPWSEHLAHLADAFDTYLTGHEPITDALRALERLDAMTGRVSADRFAATVRTVVAGLSSEDTRAGRAGAFRARGINVLDVNSLRHMHFRGVCVVGLAERSFPPAPRQDPLLLDQERQALNASQGWGLPLRARGADPEPLQFALAVGAATDRLQLSYPRTEHGSGRPLYASGFLRAAAQALAGERISAEALVDRDDAWFERLPAGRLGAPSLDEAVHQGEYDRTLLEREPQIAVPLLAAGRPAMVRGRTAWLARRFDATLTPFDAGLSPAAGQALAAHPRLAGALPPSALETFAQCSLKFFFDRVLGLRALEEPEDLPSLSALDRGSLMHTILQRALSEWLPDTPPGEGRREAHLRRLEEIASQEFAAVEKQGLTGHPQLWMIEQHVLRAELRLWYEEEVRDDANAHFDAAAFEVFYGRPPHPDSSAHSTEDPVVLDVNGHTVRLSGQIDRLQWRSDGTCFRVVDYKTGKVRGKKKAVVDGGRALQLPLYLHGGALLLDRAWQAGDAEYFYVSRRGGFARRELGGEKLAEHQQDFEAVLGAFAEAIFGGTYPARPDQWACGYCDYKGICPAVPEHLDRMAAKADDPRVAAVRAVDEIT